MRYLQDKYFDLSFQYDQIIEEIEQNYPQYYQLKYDLETAHPSKIQQELAPQKALVTYFVGTEHVFIFAISNNKSHVFQFEKPDDLVDTIEYIHDAIGIGCGFFRFSPICKPRETGDGKQAEVKQRLFQESHSGTALCH